MEVAKRSRASAGSSGERYKGGYGGSKEVNRQCDRSIERKKREDQGSVEVTFRLDADRMRRNLDPSTVWTYRSNS